MADLVFGFHDLESMRDQRIQDIGISETNERIAAWNAEVNRNFNAIFSSFAVRNEAWNTMPIVRYRQPAAAEAQFVDEMGVAKPRIEKGYYEVGLPLMRYEDAMGISYEAQRRATVDEVSRELDRIDRADMTTAIRLWLFAVLYDTNWTFVSTEENLPNIPVKAGANGDADEYIVRGESAPQTADHYTGQSGAISNSADPFPAARETLTRYAGTSPSDRLICFVGDSTNATNIQALDGFNRTDRTKYTSWGDSVSLVDPMADNFIGMGDEVLGEHEEGILVVRWRRVPANRLIFFNMDAEAPIGIREDAAPELRGLFNIDSVENSGNLLLRRFRRKIGFAPVNRTAFLCHQIGNASYSPPTGYTAIPG